MQISTARKRRRGGITWIVTLVLAGLAALTIVGAILMMILSGGTFWRDPEAMAACYTLVSQKYPDPIVVSYETSYSDFAEISVMGHVRAWRPDRVFDRVDVHFECVANFDTGYPQARITHLREQS